MEKIAAQKLVQETLENSFDKDRFVYLIKNILNHVEEAPFTYRGNYIWDDFADSIRSAERIGKYQDSEEKLIDILIINLNKETSLERARTMQRNFVAKYLNGSRGGELKDAALVAFVAPNGDDWRFSFVKMEYRFDEQGKVKEDFTPARRYSFLVGKNEHSHTAQSCLLPILCNDAENPTLAQLEEAFGVEQVTKEFFEKYRDLFLRLKESLDAIMKRDTKVKADFEMKNVDTVDFAKKLLGQIVFLYFLQKKGWFGVERGKKWGDGSRHFLRELFEKQHGDYENFFNDILEPLFYEALRLERPGDYYSRFDCRIPFLNGGLFDPLNDYDWVDTDILLPNELFSNNYKNKEGDVGNGVLDIFDRYNFTVKEDEPLEKEVAVDPEMLGKVFENLLEIKDRKSKGTYYTPREIVHYMCQESLACHLASKLEGKAKKEEIETLIKYGEAVVEHDSRVISEGRETERYAFKLPESIREHANLIDEKLETISICDPAAGSGEFVVGMMNEIIRARNALTTYLGDDMERNSYHFKRHAIQNCLYGVDIEPSAVEIAKLRLWLSLVVEEEERERIQPLPNLDYKIVQGDSLLGVEKNLLNNHLFLELEKLKPLHFDETSASKKDNYKNQIDDLISKITNGRTEFDFEVYFSEIFHENKGFDVVIGNPPYVQLQKNGGELGRRYKDIGFTTFASTGDIYLLFYEKGCELLKANGHLCYITSNKWMRAGYGNKLREFFVKKTNAKNLLDFGGFQVFENATVDTNILLIEKAPPRQQLQATHFKSDFRTGDSIGRYAKENAVHLPRLGNDTWFIGSKAEINLKEKIEQIGKPLKEWDIAIYRGVLTGYNAAFIIDNDTKERLIAEDPNSADIIKPVLRGRDIKRYQAEWTKLWLIATFPSLQLDIDNYPAVKDWLENFLPKLYQTGAPIRNNETRSLIQRMISLGLNPKEQDLKKCRKKTSHAWFEVQDTCAYYAEFCKEKIVYPDIMRLPKGTTVLSNFPYMYLDKDGYFPEATNFILTSDMIRLIFAILTSKFGVYAFVNFYSGPIFDDKGFRYKKAYLENLPIPLITGRNSLLTSQIESSVDRILTAKDADTEADTRADEAEIDQLVYQLYNLTNEEISLVES